MRATGLILLFFCGIACSAQNLVPNPGFEENEGGRVTQWTQPLNDYYHYLAITSIDSGKVSYNSVNGLCLIHPQNSEYMVVKLTEPLQEGMMYCASMNI